MVVVVAVIASGGDDDEAETADADPVSDEVDTGDEVESEETEEEAVEDEEEAGDEPVEDTSDIAGIGDDLKVGDVIFTAHGMDTAASVGGDFGSDARGTFIVVDVTILNEGSDSITVDSSFFKLKTDDAEYDSDGTASRHANEGTDFFLTKLNPGLDLTGKVVFDVPESVLEADDLRLNVQTGFFGTEQGEIILK